MELKTLLWIAGGGLALYLFVGYLIASRVRSNARSLADSLHVPMQKNNLQKSVIFFWIFKMFKF